METKKNPVPVIEGINIEEFIKNYRKKSLIVVLKNACNCIINFKKNGIKTFMKNILEYPVILFDASIE